MCGIAGTVNHEDPKAVGRILDALAHRGPDDIGELSDDLAHVRLGHRRLSIIDLSAAGHQPMSDEGGSVSVVFNGELYNYKPLTEELKAKGYVFRSTSDTEVLIHGYKEYGTDIFEKIDGMWAIALYDKAAGNLYLSRDPAGMKPLYYYHDGKSLLFASEIGALSACVPPEARVVEESALKKFLAHGYIYGDGTAYKGICAVPPASTITVSLPSLTLSTERDYTPVKKRAPHSMKEAVSEFEKLFDTSVGATLQADVPVALYLSGGIDSTLVGRTLQKKGAPLQSFTIGFGEAAFDEAPMATRIAKAFGFPQTTIAMRASDVASDIGSIFDSFGQPFADTSMLPTYYLSKHAHETGYKVALTGDGADELFGGYPTHFLPSLTSWYQKTPRITDTLLSGVAGILPQRFTKLGKKEQLTRFLHGARSPHTEAHALWKRVFTDDELERLITPHHAALLSHDASFDTYFEGLGQENAASAAMKVDFMTFLSGSCLVKSDISSMQHSVELRMPFLNKALIDFAWNLPVRFKVSPFKTKKLLRAALAHDLPRDIVRLPKQGFVPPLALWLTAELKPVLLDMLSEKEVAKTGFLEYTYVASLIEEHLAHRSDNAKKLWALMSLTRFYSRL